MGKLLHVANVRAQTFDSVPNLLDVAVVFVDIKKKTLQIGDASVSVDYSR